MYVNILDLRDVVNANRNKETLYISEFVPHVGGSKNPITQLSADRARYGIFGKVYNYEDGNRPIRPLDFNEWSRFLKITLDYFKRNNINLSADPNTLYRSYVELTQDHRVSGIVGINKSPISASQQLVFSWVPVGGKTLHIDILTYMSIFEKTFPNAIVSYSAMKAMYNKYLSALQANGAHVNATRPNIMLARRGNINQIVNDMGDIINQHIRRHDGTVVSTNDLTDIIQTGGNTRIDLTKYYQYMLDKFGFNTNNSIEMLKYASDIVKNVNLKEGAPDTASLVPTILMVENNTTTDNVKSIV